MEDKMAKKTSFNLLYVIGMALVVVGSFLPIITISLGPLGSIDLTLFKTFKSLDSLNSWYALIMVISAAVGILISFSKNKNKGLITLLALAISIICGLLLFIDAGFFKHFFKITGIGFFVIIAGWVVALLGKLTK